MLVYLWIMSLQYEFSIENLVDSVTEGDVTIFVIATWFFYD